MAKNIGPTFADELRAAGIPGDGIAWSDDGAIAYAEEVPPATRDAVAAVLAAHDPSRPARRLVAKSLILSRLSDAQLDAALALMTNRQRERWRAPDHPAIYADDPEAVALLAAIGADPAQVMAP